MHAISSWAGTLAFFILGSLFAPQAQAVEQRIECPKLAPTSIQINHIATGWTAHVPTLLRPVSAGLMFGPPAEMAVSKPDAEVVRQGKTVVKWTDLNAIRGDKWMACWYGADHDIVLSRPVHPRTNSCIVIHSKDAQKHVVLDIRCQSS